MNTRNPGAMIAVVAFTALSLTACNQSAQPNTSAEVAAAPVPPPPAPPPVPQYNRTAEQEGRWQRYMALKAAYEEQVAHARREGRQEQAAADYGRQADAFDAGRHDQARVDQAHRELDHAYQQARFEPDPRRRDEMIAQAKANLAAAQSQ